MASDYGNNFGFRRSDESMRTSEGRFKTPADAVLLQGTVVEIDPDNQGRLRAGASNVEPRPGICGLLVQEEVWDRSFYENEWTDSYDLGVTKPNRLSVVTTGAGVKVWYRNTDEETRADGRVIPSVEMFDDTNDGAGAAHGGLSVGDRMGWDGTKFVKLGGGVDTALLELTEVGTKYIEGVLLV